jgi:hypothetical protein
MLRFYSHVRLVVGLLVIRARTDRSEDVEILVLNDQLEVLHCQVPRPRFDRSDQPDEVVVMCATPDTLTPDRFAWFTLLVGSG